MNTEHLTDEEFVTILKAEVQGFYWRLFNLKVGSRFHSFLEWCGVMGEHLNIASDILNQGLPAFEMNRHTGETPPIPGYRLSYMAEKMECIFDGLITVKVAEDAGIEAEQIAESDTKQQPSAPAKPITAAQIEMAIAATTGAELHTKPRNKSETIAAIRAAALQGWERGRPEDDHSRLLRTALNTLNGPPPQTILKKVPSHWKRQDWKETNKFFRQDQACVYEANGRWHGYLMLESGIADSITDDREESEVDDGKGFGERELSFATAEEMIDWIDQGYPVQKQIKDAA